MTGRGNDGRFGVPPDGLPPPPPQSLPPGALVSPAPAKPPLNRLSTLSMILAWTWVPLMMLFNNSPVGLVGLALAVAFGVVGWYQVRRSGGSQRGTSVAILAVIVALVFVPIGLVAWVVRNFRLGPIY